MREPSKAQIITIEKIATLLRDFNNYRYPEILELLNQYNLSKHKKILVSIHADLKNKNESEYAEEFAKKYNL
ncbi:MAG TPA: hypothetical protein VEF37_06595 [Thermodesulfovibrionales bacterium]|nr:hypothetical protein [Thermodesulfovibrionales bacterium]